jgi:hypothetical protein
VGLSNNGGVGFWIYLIGLWKSSKSSRLQKQPPEKIGNFKNFQTKNPIIPIQIQSNFVEPIKTWICFSTNFFHKIE